MPVASSKKIEPEKTETNDKSVYTLKIPSFYLSTQMSVLIGALLISIAILVSGGIVHPKNTATAPTAVQSAVANPPAPAPTESDDINNKQVTVTNNLDHVRGNPDAKVTIVEFADMRCPFCEKFFTNTEPQLMTDYVNSGKVKIVFRHYAFLGSASTVAANATECASEQGKFWDMHDYLYKNQPDESDTSMFNTDKMTEVASTLKLDTAQFKSCLQQTKYADKISKDMSDGEATGVSGTPTFIVGKSTSGATLNGTALVGAQTISSFKKVIDPLLAQ